MSSEYPITSTLDEASTLAQTRPTPKHEFEGYESDIWSIVFLHDNAHIVSSSKDGTMRKWDCDTGLLVGKPWGSRRGSIYALALSPDGKTISCGRNNGSVEMWNTDGEMNEDIWTDHSSWVRALSWSPSGGHIASGSYDGTILIRKARNGELEPEVGPIETQQGGVNSLAYSDSGDRIASGGNNKTIWIWNSKTGEILVGPIEDVGLYGVISVVWSLDDSKLYSASDKSARVFDSTSGTELHRLQHNDCLYSVALSPKHNVLACVGNTRVAQLWDTESYRPLGRPFSQEDGKILRCVSFSRGYLAHSGDDLKITLWMVKDIAPELPSSPPSFLEVDATSPIARTEGDEIAEEGRDNVYDDFFSAFGATSSCCIRLFSFFPSPPPFFGATLVECSHPLSTQSASRVYSSATTHQAQLLYTARSTPPCNSLRCKTKKTVLDGASTCPAAGSKCGRREQHQC
ncbi:WD40 repeat-like protein [Rhizopogon vinicolor AM-OR11-026]|uniref:WD40 repeat-like protein n=1 Tax=Rhizopogon vinicolor AM-OR11-026 TaxID=1314800 RepID=A0A1B7MGH7_9AGAM|nr:WD40 repeat-like protein [Rhizopogon vinicolor AM-OR11-026]